MDICLKKMIGLYNLALQNEIPYPNDNYSYSGSELKITDTAGTRTVYEISGNGERCRFDNKNIAVKYLNSKGYFHDLTKSSYNNAMYINSQKRSEYIKAYNFTKEQNEHIINARRELLSTFKTYLADNYPACYVRFGKIPQNGKSYNYRDEYFENGVSVFKAYNVNNLYVIDIAGGLFTYLGYEGKKNLYLVNGTEISNSLGSDGEPLLANCKIVKQIDDDKYFDVKSYINVFFEDIKVADIGYKLAKKNVASKHTISDNVKKENTQENSVDDMLSKAKEKAAERNEQNKGKGKNRQEPVI